MTGRITLGLYNTYDPARFAEAHRRAVTRLGPVAEAFDCNIVLFGFPFPRELRTPVEVADWLSEATTIGEGGRYFRTLAERGRVAIFPYIRKGFPPQLGIPVATTRKPDENKAATPEEISELLSSGRSVCLIFGLGPHGLGRDVREACEMHLDITGRGISLETCTALGAVPARLFANAKTQAKKG
ncbi:MAG: DUF531 family protein [Thermoplasmata archaeon]|nr:DUF531 family protein [Thermoplasmata archaeon]